MNHSVTETNLAELTGRVALITGASGRIGAEIARRLGAQGASIIAHGRRSEPLETLVADLRRAGVPAIFRTGDARDEAQLAGVVTDAAAELGSIDILVAAAGGDGNPVPSAELAPRRFREIVDNELVSAFTTIHAVLPGMLESGGGTVVTISSASGLQASQSNVAYAAAKAGVVMLTRHLAKEYGPRGIRVNCVAPSMVRNERIERHLSAEAIAQVAQHFPIPRIGEPADVAAAVAYLVSDASSWVTGTVLEVTGGKTL